MKIAGKEATATIDAVRASSNSVPGTVVKGVARGVENLARREGAASLTTNAKNVGNPKLEKLLVRAGGEVVREGKMNGKRVVDIVLQTEL